MHADPRCIRSRSPRRSPRRLPFVLGALQFAALVALPGLAQAETIASGENKDGAIAVSEETDTWTLTANAGDRIVLRVAETGGNTTFFPRIQLFSPSDTLVDSSSGSQVAEVAVTASSGGTYAVEVSDNSASGKATGTYRLRLARMPGAFVVGDDGGDLTSGSDEDGTMEIGDLDPWAFAASSGDRIVLRIAETGANTSFLPRIRLYAPDGALVDSRSGGQVAELTATATSSGSYVVLVSDDSASLSGTGTYALRLAKMPGAFAASDDGGHFSAGEHGDGAIAIGDIDLWTFAATGGNGVVVNIAELTGDVSFDPQIRLYAPDGVLLDTDAGTQMAEISATLGVTGLYTVLVSDGGTTGNLIGTGTYELTVSGNAECSNGAVCRAAAGACDVAELCADYECPPDVLVSAGTSCTEDSNPCTQDACSGSSPLCQHTAGNAGSVCRGIDGPCDVAETCSGTTTACPANAFASSLTFCRAAQGACDVPETCSGSSSACPVDAVLPAGSPCSDGLFCNGADTCAGTSCSVHAGNPCSGADGDGDCSESCVEASDSCAGADPDASACNDGDACTGSDACAAGTCAGVPEPDCTTTTTTLPEILCGDATGDGKITAADALFVLRVAVGTGSCPLEVCDYTGDDEIVAGDALAVLRAAVGQDVPANCPSALGGSATTTLPESTTTTMP